MADVDSMMADYYRLSRVDGMPARNRTCRYSRSVRSSCVTMCAFRSLCCVAHRTKLRSRTGPNGPDMHRTSSIAAHESPRIRCLRIL